MLQCIIIEDQPPAQRILQKYISEIDFLELKQTFSDAIKAKIFLESNTIDVIFLDIHLPKLSGIDFLKTLSNSPKVILTTAFSEYALESYQFNVLDYLLKPISFDRFLQAISKLEATNNSNKTIFIKSGYEHIKINITDILYIKADSDYTEIVTHEKTYLSKQSLKHWIQSLQNKDFCQIHKSYIVNTNNIDKVSGNTIFVTNLELPLGRAFKKNFVENYLK